MNTYNIKNITLLAAAALPLLFGAGLPAAAHAADQGGAAKPTVVLVHGAFADSSSWDGVTAKLQADGYRVIGAANPLRSVRGDAEFVASVLKSVAGPVVLVGHSYGGSVITAAANGQANVKALVYVSAFAPDKGESALDLSNKFPGSTLGPALAKPVPLAGGGADLYIDQQKFPAQFAADVPHAKAVLMAAGQRPVTDAALKEASGEPAWKKIPSWSIYGKQDKNIPPAAMAFMAERAKSRHTVTVDGASHVVMVSHPAEVAKLIEEAATAK